MRERGKRELTQDRLGRDEDGGAVGVIEVLCALARELEVLLLVVADGYVCCPAMIMNY